MISFTLIYLPLLTFQFNYLNLPMLVILNSQNILYVYDATRTKLKKTVNGVTTYYAGGGARGELLVLSYKLCTENISARSSLQHLTKKEGNEGQVLKLKL